MASLYDHSASNSFLNDSEQNTDREDSEYLESNMQKLEDLKRICFNKNLERKLIKKCLDSLHAEIYVTNILEKNQEKSISNMQQIKNVRYLLEQKEELNKKAIAVSEEHRVLEEQIVRQKLSLKDSIKRRRKIMNEVTRLREFISGKLTISSFSDNSDDMEALNKNYLKRFAEYMIPKSFSIAMISRILHNLVCFSNKPWVADKNLLEIILCTSKILNRYLNIENKEEFKKVIDDDVCKLIFIKI